MIFMAIENILGIIRLFDDAKSKGQEASR